MEIIIKCKDDIIRNIIIITDSHNRFFNFLSGDPTVIDDLTIDQIDKNTLLIRWGIIYDMNLNYTQSITIQDTSNNTNSNIITVDNYLYDLIYELDNPNTCTEYNITLNVNTNITTCSDSRTVSITTGNQYYTLSTSQ